MYKVRTPWPVATRIQYIVAFQECRCEEGPPFFNSSTHPWDAIWGEDGVVILHLLGGEFVLDEVTVQSQ